MLGSGGAVAVGKDIDVEAIENSSDLSRVPVGVTIKGDPSAIDDVLGKIHAKVGSDLAFLGSDSAGDLEAIGPSAAYRRHLLVGGHLGDDDTFQGVVPDAANASSVIYVDVDALEPAIKKAAAGDPKTLDNLTPSGRSGCPPGGTATPSGSPSRSPRAEARSRARGTGARRRARRLSKRTIEPARS